MHEQLQCGEPIELEKRRCSMSDQSTNRPLRLLLGAAAIIAALTLGARAWAAEPLQPMQVVSAGAERFVSGGVGEQERKELFESMPSFDLLVSFARRDDGSFLTGVDVEVRRAGHASSTTVFTTAGPYLLAKLPAGHYELTASLPGWSSAHHSLDIEPGKRERIYVALEPQHPAEKPAVSQR
jgi:hypothetical protein